MRSAVLAVLAASLLAAPAVASEYGGHFLTLEAYKPTYFLVGRPDSKVQFSFKSRPVKSWDLYLAYSQLMKWELFAPSAPIRDVNFNPELFYRWRLVEEGLTVRESDPEPPHHLDIGLYNHESNGRDGPDSRAWDTCYLRYVRGFRLGETTTLILSTKLIASLRTDVATADFLWYRGLYEIEAALVHFWESTFDESELRFRFFPGGPSHLDPTAGGQELTLRLKPRANTFVPTLFAQVFHGYGENMLDYKTRRFVFRVGLGF